MIVNISLLTMSSLPFELDGDNLKGYYYENNIPKYKIEHKDDRFKYPKMENFRRKDKYVYTPTPWNIDNDITDNNFEPRVNYTRKKIKVSI